MDDRNNTPNPATGAGETKPVESEPTESKPAQPNYVGNTGIIDRSGVQSRPTVLTPETPDNIADFDAKYRDASMAFSETKVLLLGLGSATSSILILYVVKNFWATVIISAILAGAALFFAVKDYRSSPRMTPLTVVGISAATITIVYLANILVTRWIVTSAIQGLGY